MAQQGKRVLRFGRFRLDPEEGALFLDNSVVSLTPKTFQTLLLLAENHGRVVEKDELIRRIWPDTVVEEGNLSFNVHQARRALGGHAEEFIATVPRRGYRFVAPVRETWEAEASCGQTQEYPALREAEPDRNGAGATSHPAPAKLSARSRIWLATGTGLLAGASALLYFSSVVPASELSLLSATPLTGAPGWEWEPSFSPDGQQLAYTWFPSAGKSPQVYVRSLSSADALPLTSAPESVHDMPRWSPDGQQIAFVRASGAHVEFYMVDAAGGEEKLIARPSGIGPVFGFDWSPDGKRLAYTRSPRRGAPSAIFLLELESGRQTQLTHPAGPIGDGVFSKHGDRDVSFSPDGRTLAFARYRDFRGDIYRVPIEGDEPQRLTFDDTRIYGLAWTGDGREIVFSSHPSGEGALWRIPASGGTPVLVTDSPSRIRLPTVSRYANRLAFVGVTGDHNLWRIPVGNSSEIPQRSRVIDWTGIDAAPDASPDGERIAFMSNRSGTMEIWACNRDGKKCGQFTSFGGPHTGSPRWSPDSQWIAFTSRPHGNDDIFIVNLRLDAPRRITSEASEDTAPSWSRDGQWIYFGSNRSGRFEIWKAPVNGEPAVQVTQKGGFAAFESPDGRFLFYTKRSAPGLWQMPIEGGAETLILRDHPAAMLWGYWAVTERGVYVVSERGSSEWSLNFFDFLSRENRVVAQLPGPPGKGGPGLTVTPDGGHIVISLMDRVGSNIMVVDNFF